MASAVLISVHSGTHSISLEFQQSNLNTLSILLFLIGILRLMRFTSSVLASSQRWLLQHLSSWRSLRSSSKVYSPQYVLWLTPLAILAMRGKKDRPAFWIWQGAELTYHLAIWEYLASYSGSHFGLPARAYATATLIRIAATIYFAARVSTRSAHPQNLEFLISQTGGLRLAFPLQGLAPVRSVVWGALTLLPQKSCGRFSPKEVGLTHASL
jgi:hypothetical protein